MLFRQIFPLFLAHAQDGEPIEGRTRLQKMMFLLQQQIPNSPQSYNFHAYDYGPYCSNLQSDVDSLIQEGYLQEIEIQMIDGKLKYRYQITNEGKDLVQSLLRSRKLKKYGLKEIYGQCEQMKEKTNHKNLNDLLKEVYSHYPEFAKFSVFKF